jgi:hypothetical protein
MKVRIMRNNKPLMLLLGAVLLAGCAQQPLGPMVRVMPGPNKPFDAFQRDQYDCKNYASDQVAGASQNANNRAVGATAVGALLGLGIGAATGGGRSAATGAAVGGGAGALVGASESDRANFSIQRRYDDAYVECMSSKGNQVPGYGGGGPRGRRGYGPPPNAYGPPPGYGPPPPPPPPPGS